MARAVLTFFFLMLPTPVYGADSYTLHDYGKACYARLGVALPKIDCLSPKATVLQVTVDGKPVPEGTYVSKCDRPAHISQGGFPCAPGGRLLRFESENARGETVVTQVICRRYRNRAMNSPIFDDIGIIQHNTKTNDSCWFANTDNSGKGWDGTKIPEAYAPGRARNSAADRSAQAFWNSPQRVADGQCIRCHAASIWIRTPFVAQAKRDKKNDNAVPDNVNHGTIKYVGAPFDVWNKNPPNRIRINAAAYDKLYPPKADEKRMAPPDRCTECHALGQHKWTGATCIGVTWRSAGDVDHEATLSGEWHKAWMPPTRKFKLASDKEKFKNYYKRSLEAADRCCRNPNLTAEVDGKRVKVCDAPPAEPSKEISHAHASSEAH